MKKICSLNLGLLLALVASTLIIGCSTAEKVRFIDMRTSQNAIVILNDTPYIVRIYRSGTPWENWGHSDNKPRIPTLALPMRTLILPNVTTNDEERISLTLVATKPFMIGCVTGETPVGTAKRVTYIGINEPPLVLTLHKRDF